MTKPYTLITAYHQELPNWKLGPADRALLMAFVWCLKMRMDGNDPDSIIGPTRPNLKRKTK